MLGKPPRGVNSIPGSAGGLAGEFESEVLEYRSDGVLGEVFIALLTTPGLQDCTLREKAGHCRRQTLICRSPLYLAPGRCETRRRGRRRYAMLVFRRIFAMIHKWLGLHRPTLNQRTQTLSE